MSKNPLKDYILRMVRDEEQNFILVVCGKQGSGKSSFSLAIAEELSPNFSRKNICYTSRDFLAKLDDPDLKTGDVIVWEEVGLGHSNLDWYTVTNQTVNSVLQSFRDQHLITIMNLPLFKLMDPRSRGLIHAYVTTRIDRANKHVVGKFRFVNTNPISGKIYRQRPRMYGGKKIGHVRTYLPSKELWTAYKRDSNKYKKLVRKNARATITGIEIRKNAKVCEFTNEEIVKEISHSYKDFIRRK